MNPGNFSPGTNCTKYDRANNNIFKSEGSGRKYFFKSLKNSLSCRYSAQINLSDGYWLKGCIQYFPMNKIFDFCVYSGIRIILVMLFSCETAETPVVTNIGNTGNSARLPGWQPLALVLQEDLNDVYFISEQSGWIVGKNKTLLATASGDIGWGLAPVYLPLENLNSVFFIDDQTGWIAGDLSGSHPMGQVGYSGNGGGYPVQLGIFETPLNALFFLDGSTGWVAGENGLLARTTNGGSEWRVISPFTQETIFDMTFSDENNGWLVTGNGGIFHTVNGQNWEIEGTGKETDILAIHIQAGDDVWACGKENTILHREQGEDGSFVWQETTIRWESPNMIWRDIFFVDPQTGWIAGDFGRIYKTEDGGINWEEENSGVLAQLNSIFMVNRHRGWAVGDDGTVVSYVSD